MNDLMLALEIVQSLHYLERGREGEGGRERGWRRREGGGGGGWGGGRERVKRKRTTLHY